jgi:hypothetical protein
MPGNDGLFTAEEMQKIEAWIHTKWGTKPCEMCGHVGWAIGKSACVAPVLLQSSPGQLGVTLSNFYPLAAVSCANCSNEKFINLISVGVLALQPPPAEAPNV